MNKIILAIFMFSFTVCLCHADEKLVGKLKEPLGTVITIQGIVVDGPHKGYENGPNICVQKINGRATQQDIQIKLDSYYWGEFKKEEDIDKLRLGQTYEFEGFETGSFVGMPKKIYQDYLKSGRLIQTSGFHLVLKFAVYKGRQIDKIIFSPSEFIDRFALIQGRANNEGNSAYIISDNWKLLVDATKPWPNYFIQKLVEARGIIRKPSKANIYKLERGKTQLVKLEDQIGRKVELRGTAWSLNGDWWLDYRGTTVFVENMNKLPNWNTDNNHGAPVLITGILEEKMMPPVGEEKPLNKSFFIRSPEWKALDALLSPEKEYHGK